MDNDRASLGKSLTLAVLLSLFGVGLLVMSFFQVSHLFEEVNALLPVIVVSRLPFVAAGAGIGLLGAALMIWVGDVANRRERIRPFAVLMFTGFAFMIVAPLPASAWVESKLKDANYTICEQLTKFDFKFSKRAWVADEALCPP